MIEYVHTQLSIWGRAQRCGAREGLGYPSVCPMFRDVRHGGAYGSAPPPGVSLIDRQNIDDTAEAVRRLSDEHRRLVAEYYIVGGTAVAVAARLGIARQRLYERLSAVHAQMLGLLNDVVAGV